MTRASELLAVKSNEEFDPEAALKALIDTEFSKSEEEKGKAAQLLKGLFFADDEKSKEVIAELDQWFSGLSVD